MWKEILRRIRYLGRRPRFEAELEDEIRFHLEARADELERAGMERRATLAQARRELGPSARIAEEARAAWQFRWLEDLFSDLRYAARAFRRNPAFALTAIACLALGIGANTTIFSVLSNTILRELPFPNPERLMLVLETQRHQKNNWNIVSAPNFNGVRNAADRKNNVEPVTWTSVAFRAISPAAHCALPRCCPL